LPKGSRINRIKGYSTSRDMMMPPAIASAANTATPMAGETVAPSPAASHIFHSRPIKKK
jgi:hypothetical protein